MEAKIYNTCDLFMSSYQTFPNFCYLLTLCYFINFCRLIKLLSPYQTFVVLSNFCRLIKLLSSSHPLLFTHFTRYLLTI